MQLNWLAYQYRETDGYGRYSNRMIAALQSAGVAVHPMLHESVNMPVWMQSQLGISWDKLTISCLPPYFLNRIPGRHWLLSMTEGGRLPDGWADIINKSGVERVIVPCKHNVQVFAAAGVQCPVDVVPGGTDPDEFPLIAGPRPERPHTFLALADRGARKGWVEVWQAFYAAFGTPDRTPHVRLIIKSRPDGNDMLSMIANAERPDPRISIVMDDVDMRDLYRSVDCFAIPSRSEGWGMPHREAAMMGVPVITQRYSGMDDGHTHEWAMVLKPGTLEPIPGRFTHIAGDWMKCDVADLAWHLNFCYEFPDVARNDAYERARWLRQNQTWTHSAKALLKLIGEVS